MGRFNINSEDFAYVYIFCTSCPKNFLVEKTFGLIKEKGVEYTKYFIRDRIKSLVSQINGMEVYDKELVDALESEIHDKTIQLALCSIWVEDDSKLESKPKFQSSYLVQLEDKRIVVIAENIQDAIDKLEKNKIDFRHFVYTHSFDTLI